MTADSESNQRREAGLALVVSEFEFVSGLIPFYRRVELTALGGSGLVVSAALTAYTALTTGATDQTKVAAAVLAAAAWGPALLLLVEVMALTRLTRASLYIQQRLHPLAVKLSSDEKVLSWELEPTESLIASLDPQALKSAAKVVVTSIPVIALMTGAVIGLGVFGIATEATTASEAIAIPAMALAVPFAAYGVRLTWRHETRRRGTEQGAGEAHVWRNRILCGVVGALVGAGILAGVHAFGFV